MRTRSPSPSVVAGLVCVLAAAAAEAFVPAEGTAAASRWTFTANGSTGSPGDPVTLTWSIVPDGTTTLDLTTQTSTSPSNLIAELDAEFGAGPGGSDYTLRPWFSFFEQSFDRWSEVAAVTYVYEPNDDGLRHGSFSGSLGVRGDVRVSGVSMDGGGGTLAYNYFPNNGDMGIDTDDLSGLFSNAVGDHVTFRNTIMHEAAHGLGLEHVDSSDVGILLDPTISTSFDGPQHDDLRGVHWLYGDVLEKAPAGRNETFALASDLGALADGGSLTIGAGGSGAFVAADETDFVSITNENDTDFFSFTIAEPLTIDAVMTPRGAEYTQNGQQFVTTETADLTLAIFDTDGTTLLAESSLAATGVAETIVDLALASAGTYYARVESASAAADQVVQFYQLDLSSASLVVPELLGDFNLDGVVDAADYTLLRDTFLTSVDPYTGADHSGDGLVGIEDYGLWLENFGSTADGAAAVPEPTVVVLFACSVCVTVGRNPSRTKRRV